MRYGPIALGAGGAIMVGLVAWFGARAIGEEVVAAAWALPFIVALHVGQLWLSAVAWRFSIGRPAVTLRLRWIRESVNSLLPVAQLGGNLVAVRLLMQSGVSGALAGAGTTLDLTIEALTQFVFTIMGIAVLATLDVRGEWETWLDGGLVFMAAALVGFVIAQRAGLMRLVESLTLRLSTLFPTLSLESVRGLHAELMRLQSNWHDLARAAGLHMLAWTLGVAETWIAFSVMGVPASAAAVLVVESLGMAVRSAGFVVPGALGIQEGGFILVSGLFGIPADDAMALSMLKRLRELAIGLPGLVVWQWEEGRRLLARPGAGE